MNLTIFFTAVSSDFCGLGGKVDPKIEQTGHSTAVLVTKMHGESQMYLGGPKRHSFLLQKLLPRKLPFLTLTPALLALMVSVMINVLNVPKTFQNLYIFALIVGLFMLLLFQLYSVD